MIVVFIIAILAAVALPSLRSADPEHLRYAVSEVTSALVFARDRARATGTPHGVRFYEDTETLKVFRMSGAPGTYAEVYDVRHPLDKNLYTASMSAPGSGAVPDISSLNFSFEGANEDAIAFNYRGDPRQPHADMKRGLTSGYVTLDLGQQAATVRVNAAGRIWVD